MSGQRLRETTSEIPYASEPKQVPGFARLEELDKSLDVYATLVENLSIKLEHILLPSNPEESSNYPERPSESKFMEEFFNKIYRLNGINSTLDSIIERINI